MEHQTTLVLTVALGFVVAFVFGFIASRLGVPPLVGYLVAGVAIGPYTPGFHADTAIASQLAEVGVILLMFGVGLHFSTADLWSVRWIAIPGAIVQIASATGMGALLAWSWGWTIGEGLALGLALSVASTVVILRALGERNAIETANGRIAIAWTVVEDIAMVVTLVLLPALARVTGAPSAAADAGGGPLVMLLALTVGKIAVFLALVALVGPRVVPWLLRQAARTGSHELFTVAVLAIALGIAYGSSALFGVSFALGAFCAGVVLSNSELSQRAAEESLPLQHAFAVLFFVSVGMLFNPQILVREPFSVVAVLLIILIGKSLGAFAIVQLMGYPIGTALTVSASLAQIGEFSFILAGLGVALGLMPAAATDLILAGALLSVTLNPLMFALVRPAQAWLSGFRRVMARMGPAQDLRLARLQAELDANRAAEAKAIVRPDELVSRWPVFADLDATTRAELLALLQPSSAVPGERLIRAGTPGDKAFFISSGEVEVAVRGRRFKLGAGDFFGEMALLTGAPRSADVTAIDYTQLFTLLKDDFQRFLARHPELGARIDLIARQREEMNREAAPETEAPVPSPAAKQP